MNTIRERKRINEGQRAGRQAGMQQAAKRWCTDPLLIYTQRRLTLQDPCPSALHFESTLNQRQRMREWEQSRKIRHLYPVCVCMCIFNSKSYSCKASLHVFNKLDTSSQGAHMYSFSYTRSHGHFLSDKASKYVLWAASFSDHTWESAWLAVCLENIICMQSHMCMYMLEDGAVKGILYSFPFLC